MATCPLRYSPRQTSVSPPDARAMLPRFSSPAESTAEVGSCKVTLHTFPKVDIYFAFCASMDGYACAKIMEGMFREIKTTYLIDFIHKFRLVLWCQSLNVPQ
jgi:hypothetical protein